MTPLLPVNMCLAAPSLTMLLLTVTVRRRDMANFMRIKPVQRYIFFGSSNTYTGTYMYDMFVYIREYNFPYAYDIVKLL